MRVRSERTTALLTRSGLAQWPFRAVETLPMIRSFICWVASGLSLWKESRSLVSYSEHAMPLFTPRGSEKMNAWMVKVIWSQLFYFFPGTRLHL